ncbi:MAG: response regulator transcription factor [Chloroflexi bacterium]|nr:response regulator transcription factor [Chloroflexota bacterium]
MTAIRILIVDDHPTFRRTISAGLEDYPNDLQVVGEAADGQRAIDLVEHVQPDVVLMDIRMRGMDGVSTTRILRERYPSCRVILLTSHCERELVVDGLQAGATGYVLKEYGGEELVRAIVAAYHGETVLSPPVATTVLHEFLDSRPRQTHKPVKLSRQEIEILRGVAVGQGYWQIAQQLVLSEGTVSQYVKRIIEKLGATNRVHAVAIAKDLRII